MLHCSTDRAGAGCSGLHSPVRRRFTLGQSSLRKASPRKLPCKISNRLELMSRWSTRTRNRRRPNKQSCRPLRSRSLLTKNAFRQEESTLQPVRPHKKTRIASVTRMALKGAEAQFGSVKALVMYAPRPVYPYEARRQRMTGSGIALLTVALTGNVIEARMAESSGSVILDSATLEALRRWRFKPGSVLSVEVPITYSLTGASY